MDIGLFDLVDLDLSDAEVKVFMKVLKKYKDINKKKLEVVTTAVNKQLNKKPKKIGLLKKGLFNRK